LYKINLSFCKSTILGLAPLKLVIIYLVFLN